MKPSALKTLLTAAITSREPILIKGAPGIGKTDIVEQAAADAGADVLTVYCACSDPTDPKGMPATWYDQDAGTQKADFIAFGFLSRLISTDKPLVCFLDDVGGAPPSVQLGFMNLVHARKTGDGTPISDFVTFIAATNRREDRAGVAGMLEPFKSRFCSIVELTVDLDEWVKWGLPRLPIELISFIRYRPNLLHDPHPSTDLINSPSPRTVAKVGKLMGMGLPGNVEFEAFSGAAGEGFAAELVGFLKIFRDLPNPDQILLNPDSVPVPTDPAVLYALTGALARKCSPNTIDRILKYTGRMPAEFQVLMMRDATALNPDICMSAAFVSWCSDNKDVLL